MKFLKNMLKNKSSILQYSKLLIKPRPEWGTPISVKNYVAGSCKQIILKTCEKNQENLVKV